MSEISFDLVEVRKKAEEYAKRIQQLSGTRQMALAGIHACSCSGGCDGGCEMTCSGRCYGCGKS